MIKVFPFPALANLLSFLLIDSVIVSSGIIAKYRDSIHLKPFLQTATCRYLIIYQYMRRDDRQVISTNKSRMATGWATKFLEEIWNCHPTDCLRRNNGGTGGQLRSAQAYSLPQCCPRFNLEGWLYDIPFVSIFIVSNIFGGLIVYVILQ